MAVLVKFETKKIIKMGITDKIAEIEREIARTQKNKGKILLRA